MIKTLVYSLIMSVMTTPVTAQMRFVFPSTDTPIARICEKIITDAYQQLGLHISIENYPANRAIRMSNDGEFDGAIARVAGIEKLYPNLLMVPVKLHSVETMAFTKDQNLSASGWDDLKPYKIGVMSGAILAEQLTKGMNVTSVGTVRQLFLMLERGRVDVIVVSRLTGLDMIKQLQLEGVNIIEPPLITINVYHYVHKKHVALIPNLTKVMQKMESSGRIEEIRKQVVSEHQ